MRVRAERHDEALAAMREEHQVQLKQLEKKHKQDLIAQQQLFQEELERRNADTTTVLENALVNQQQQHQIEIERVVKSLRSELEEEFNSRVVSIVNQKEVSSLSLYSCYAFY
jgi:hypothetical protein